MENWTWEICIIGLALTAFTLINILSKSYKHQSDWLLCIWLVLLNIPLFHTTLSYLDHDAPRFNLVTNPTLNLLHGPILYLYVQTLVSNQKISFGKSELLHLIPFVVFYIAFISMDHSQPMRPTLDNPEHASSLFALLMARFGLINGLIFIAYSIATIFALRKHQKNISGIFSRNDNLISLKWLFALPATFAVLVILNFLNEGMLDSTAVIKPLTFHMLSFLSFTVLLCFFGVKQKPVFLFQPALTEVDIALKTAAANDGEIAVEAPDTSACDMSDEATAQLIEAMQEYMLREKPFLNADFSVYTLADAVNTPRRNLSQVLNNGLSKNFYQYVNEYRIEEVKRLLKDPALAKSTILDIAFRCGFKSKSSFNSLFKQHCEMTPSQYRKQLKQHSPVDTSHHTPPSS